MATIGIHDAPLRGHVLVDGVVTFRADDFDADVTKEEVLAKFFVPDNKMDAVSATVAMYGPFCGLRQWVYAVQQAERGAWEEAEQLLLEGTRQLAPLSSWVPALANQVEQCRREVSGLLLAGEPERVDLIGPVLLSLRSVGCYVDKT
jgi:hypothetical protein